MGYAREAESNFVPGIPPVTVIIICVRLRNRLVDSLPATITMQTIGDALNFVVGELSDHNYAQSLDFYRFWCGTGQTHLQIPSDQIFDAIWNKRAVGSLIDPNSPQLIHSTAHLILRFASDVESDRVLATNSSGLQGRLCAGSLREFSSNNLMAARYGRDAVGNFYADTNLIAHWTNLGYVDEATIRDHVLQSLISHPKLYDHQADALIILFKLAGLTFETYAGPAVVDRCFELLKGHSYNIPYPHYSSNSGYNVNSLRVKKELVQVRTPRAGAERWPSVLDKFLGGSRVTRAWLGGTPSPTCIRGRDPKIDWHKPERSRCNPCCHIPRTP